MGTSEERGLGPANRAKKARKILFLAVVLVITGRATVAQELKRKALFNPPPQYPQIARRIQLRGTVKIEIVIAPDGSVKDAKVLGGHALLAESALNAVKDWKFAPASSETTERIEFKFNP